jgi:hypothetical protein
VFLSLTRTRLFIEQADREKLQMKRILQESKRVPQAKGFGGAWFDGDGDYQVRRGVNLRINTAREWLLSFTQVLGGADLRKLPAPASVDCEPGRER